MSGGPAQAPGSPVILGLAVLFLAALPFAPGFQWHHGLHFDISDIVFLPLLGLLARQVRARDAGRPGLEGASFWSELPHRRLWCVYAVLTALAYAGLAYEAGYLGVGAPYQFYRYCWKPLLLYPLTFYAVARAGGRGWIVAAAVLTADIHAAAAIWQGRSGVDVRGALSLYHKNMLAGSLLVPCFLALGEAMGDAARWRRLAAQASVALMGAGLWYAVSRGALVGALIGGACFVLLSQKRFHLMAAVMMLAALVLLARPDIGSSGILGSFVDIGNGVESGNMAWRVKERWPHFMSIVLAHPWFGVGDEVDLSLGVDANTPHNGYLALMVRAGIPATVCYLLLLAIGLGRSSRLALTALSPRARNLAAAACAGLVAFSVHNLVETTFEKEPAGAYVWLACGLIAALHLEQRHERADATPAATRRTHGVHARRGPLLAGRST